MQPKLEKICPQCGEPLVPRKGPYGNFLGCPNYKECGFRGLKIDGLKTEQQGSTTGGGSEEIMSALRKIYAKLEDIENGIKDLDSKSVIYPQSGDDD